SPALPRQRFVGACRRAVEPCPSSLGGVWPGRGSPAARGPAPLPSPCEGSPSPSRASVHAGETDVQLPGPLVHLGLGPPLGCELTASTKSYTFQVDKEDDSDHILALSVVCLTDGAKDECNVVEVVGRNHENQEIAVPVANLKLSCQPLLSLDNFKLQPPVTFRLAAGSGPVHLTGWHKIMHREDASFEEDDDLSEEDEEELPPIMPAKK
ncbi:nucleoplasmin-3, partial [Cyanistes caeruleus]|uniref:Nucleoplasmin-3 n=1 Tax=Cyanistes caeruleus TaxID=156563 RepID=A0A8C0VKC6_CYACU